MRTLLMVLVLACAAPSCASRAAWQGDLVTWSAEGGGDLGQAAGVFVALQAYYQDMSARDWEAYADHFWDGAVIGSVWPPPGSEVPVVQLTTVPEFVARTPEGPDSASIFAEWMTHAEIRVDGILAEAWVRYEAEFGEPDALMEWSGIDSFSLVYHEGRWRIVSLAYAANL